jgi:hypothetical protein
MAVTKANVITLLASGANWTTGAGARKANGKPCAPCHPLAVKWDLEGALMKLCRADTPGNYTTYHALLANIESNIPGHQKDIGRWNDGQVWNAILGILNA